MRGALLAVVVLGCGARTTATPPGFVRIAAGSFVMGAPATAAEHTGNDAPHEVRITRDFFLEAREVTRREFRELMGAVPEPWRGETDDTPVTRVNWYEAVAYANARSRRDGVAECYRLDGETGRPGGGCHGEFGCGPGALAPDWATTGYAIAHVELVGLDCPGYRLPTEAEWEYAARAGQTPAELAARVHDTAWTRADAETAKPVGTKAPSPWGLYDMLGNVWEHVGDAASDLGSAAAVDPTGPDAGSGAERVARGGSYVNDVEVTVTWRLAGSATGRNANVGFRLARTAR